MIRERSRFNKELMCTLEQGFGVNRRGLQIPELELFDSVIKTIRGNYFKSGEVYYALNFIREVHERHLCEPVRISSANAMLDRFLERYNYSETQKIN